MDENGEIDADAPAPVSISDVKDEGIEMEAKVSDPALDPFMNGEIKTLDGEIAGDEFVADAINYQVLLGKIDGLLERLKLDA